MANPLPKATLPRYTLDLAEECASSLVEDGARIIEASPGDHLVARAAKIRWLLRNIVVYPSPLEYLTVDGEAREPG